MLSLLSQDLIALERHYRKSCYREYTQKVENLSTFSNESKSSSGSNLYKDVELEAFREIVKECYEQTINVPKVLKFRDLLKNLKIYFPLKILPCERLNKKVSPKKSGKAQYYQISKH